RALPWALPLVIGLSSTHAFGTLTSINSFARRRGRSLLSRLVFLARRVGELDQGLGSPPILLDEGSELRRCAGRGNHRLLPEQGKAFRAPEQLDELGIEPLDDRLRRALRRRQTPPSSSWIGI